MKNLDPGRLLLETPLDDGGALVVDPRASRWHQARILARLDPEATDALVLQLYRSVRPGPDRTARRPSSDWIRLRARLIAEQGLREAALLE